MKFVCWMGWHKAKRIGYDGCSAMAVCKYCGVKLLQDSNLNWFAVTRSNDEKPHD